MKKAMLSAAGLAVALAAPAFGQDEGWYGKAGVGYGAYEDLESDSLFEQLESEGDLRFMLGVGYAFANGFRMDFDVMDRYSDTGAPGNVLPGTSDIQNIAIMMNGIYDFNRDGRISPYVGLGFGFSRDDFSFQSDALGGAGTKIDEEETAIAYQGLVGLGYSLSDRLTADLEYRYFTGQDITFDFAGSSIELDRPTSHDVLVGLRYAFGSAPAAAPAAAAPAAAAPVPAPRPPVQRAEPAPVAAACDASVDFIVYFEWDRSSLTDAAKNVIADAADRAQDCELTRVSIEGHADRSGSASYNVRLSERRARVVRDELIRIGVPASIIGIEAKGEAEPAVATPDGAREPLNRRTEVVIRVE